jgi:hypothetical protein
MNVVLNHRLFCSYECGINISIIFSSLFHYYRIYYELFFTTKILLNTTFLFFIKYI